MTSPLDQDYYQVRFDWGSAGVRRVCAGVDVVVVVDVLDAPGESGHTEILAAVPDAAAVVAGSLRNRRAVADWVLEQQAVKRDRFRVAVIAAGDASGGEARFAVEDLLGAGGVIDALIESGIDHNSPEAAAAAAAFSGLRRALRHLIGASGNGRVLAADGHGAIVAAAAELDADSEVVVLRYPAAG